MIVYGVEHTGRAGRLNAVDLAFGFEALNRICDSAYQSAAAYRHDDGIHVGKLIEYFETDRTLSRYHVVVVERMDERIAVFFLQFQRLVVRVVVNALDQAYLCAEAFGRLYLGYRSDVGQADKGLDPVFVAASATPCA